jgi:hypothetical protein
VNGLVRGLAEQIYHADKTSLSVSGAKKLLPPSCPAIFKWELDHGQPDKPAFEYGRAAHSVVLGAGRDIEVVEADSWRSKAAKEHADTIRAGGSTPVLRHEWEQIRGMAEAIRAHPVASRLLDPAHGEPEVSAYWDDEVRGVRRRARFDWLPNSDGGQLLIPDYKTAQSADPDEFGKAVARYNYHMQAAWYCDMTIALGLAEDVTMAFIVQEKAAPYLVSVYEPDTEAMMVGRGRNDQAIRIWRECTENDTWPGHSSGIELLALPVWATYDQEMV